MNNHLMYPEFQVCTLDTEHSLWRGRLPEGLLPNPQQFDDLWALHPDDYNEIRIHGRTIKTPRWEQAYNKAYCYAGVTNLALPVPKQVGPIWNWVKATIDSSLNGILLTWYDGQLGHYIGKHRDSVQNMIVGAPIVTVSLGQPRIFRLRPWQGKGYWDFPTDHGTVFILPYRTNLAWTHEIPASKKLQGQRIAIAFRAFE
ncbi:MAG: 2OG-Fe(II) oxygenase [Cyanothece sp. SIO1E1]|nr:2OG-Fe(II) oxygenase [Cyanothece sp. SIO1E1]